VHYCVVYMYYIVAYGIAMYCIHMYNLYVCSAIMYTSLRMVVVHVLVHVHGLSDFW
jgi:hypothetical protein